MKQLQFKSFDQCTIQEITDLWNIGFKHYLNDMSITVAQMTTRLGACHIHPQLSVAAYIDGEPVGFVFVGIREIHGQKTAWNGGTGINPSFRGRGLSKQILQEAIRRIREEQVPVFYLETRLENTPAIAAYRSVGFEIVHQMPILRRSGDFAQVPFRREKRGDYLSVISTPEAVSGLPFYLHHTAWMNQWFNMANGQSLIVFDRSGEAAGYALFSESLNNSGQRSSVKLTHCEPNPSNADKADVVRFMLAKIYEPFDEDVSRITHYMRSTNVETTDALTEAGFTVDMAEHLMMLRLN